MEMVGLAGASRQAERVAIANSLSQNESILVCDESNALRLDGEAARRDAPVQQARGDLHDDHHHADHTDAGRGSPSTIKGGVRRDGLGDAGRRARPVRVGVGGCTWGGVDVDAGAHPDAGGTMPRLYGRPPGWTRSPSLQAPHAGDGSSCRDRSTQGGGVSRDGVWHRVVAELDGRAAGDVLTRCTT